MPDRFSQVNLIYDLLHSFHALSGHFMYIIISYKYIGRKVDPIKIRLTIYCTKLYFTICLIFRGQKRQGPSDFILFFLV